MCACLQAHVWGARDALGIRRKAYLAGAVVTATASTRARIASVVGGEQKARRVLTWRRLCSRCLEGKWCVVVRLFTGAGRGSARRRRTSPGGELDRRR